MKIKKNLDYTLIIAIVLLIIFGLIILYSASYQKKLTTERNFIIRQGIWVVIGLFCAWLVVRLNHHKFIELAYLLYGLNILMLILVLVPGIGSGLYANRWLGFGGIYIQPSEFAKLTLVLALARYLGLDAGDVRNPRAFLLPLVMTAVPMGLIFIQPDLGTAVIFIPILIIMFYTAGVRLKHLLIMIGTGLVTAPWLGYLLYKLHIIKNYQVRRLLVFIKPDFEPLGAGYTIIQSKIAIGSGQLMGKSWLGGTQNRLNFLPERHTDFIFSVVGEEWGLMGACFLLLLYFVIIQRGLSIGAEVNNKTGRLTAIGLVSVILCHVIVNTGVATGIMPVTGLSLPLVSYGGSSIITTLIAVGLLLSIRLREHVF
ncbi:MAG: rod shape-determining protein RodA [Candidatus Omnitrophica bacterium]|nr:rod shape-determining protein RodA [Candidatus Omnitrophota bacterium]